MLETEPVGGHLRRGRSLEKKMHILCANSVEVLVGYWEDWEELCLTEQI